MKEAMMEIPVSEAKAFMEVYSQAKIMHDTLKFFLDKELPIDRVACEVMVELSEPRVNKVHEFIGKKMYQALRHLR